jgi:predicted DCC family thiol-disulfide oxidoreductase YuxK
MSQGADTGRAGGEYDVEVFFDGQCPLCSKEIRMLRGLDRGGRIRFTDIADPGFEAARHGRTLQELMNRIHGRLPDGTWIEGVEVFRRLYDAAGLRGLVAVTRWPIVSPALDAAYGWFARNRLRLTGRCTPEVCTPGHVRGQT